MRHQRIKLGIIGAGNLGEAILTGLIRKKKFRGGEIGFTVRRSSRRRMLAHRFGIRPYANNRRLAQETNLLLLTVKPQQMKGVLEEIADTISPSHLLLTVAAGLETSFYRRILPRGARLIRAMPNTPIKIGYGMTGLYAAAGISRRDKKTAEAIFGAVGKTVFVSGESQLDVVTALSAGGPAFLFLFLHALIRAGTRLGLPATVVEKMALQTVAGAGLLADRSSDSPEKLILNVASKRGTTEAGLKVLKRKGFVRTLEEAVRAATRRARSLREEIGG